MTSNASAEKKPAAKQGNILQVVLSLIIFAGFVVFLFVPDLISYETSLFTQILNVFKNVLVSRLPKVDSCSFARSLLSLPKEMRPLLSILLKRSLPSPLRHCSPAHLSAISI